MSGLHMSPEIVRSGAAPSLFLCKLARLDRAVEGMESRHSLGVLLSDVAVAIFPEGEASARAA